MTYELIRDTGGVFSDVYEYIWSCGQGRWSRRRKERSKHRFTTLQVSVTVTTRRCACDPARVPLSAAPPPRTPVTPPFLLPFPHPPHLSPGCVCARRTFSLWLALNSAKPRGRILEPALWVPPALAAGLGLDVYIVSLSRTGLDDNALQELIADLPEKCIALIEDIDAAFHHSINRASEKPGEKLITGDKEQGPASNNTPKVTLSGLLNALDGVGAQEGRLLFATTNRYEALDAALRRPGRMDAHVEFRLASQGQASELFRRFYAPNDTAATGPEDPGHGEKLLTLGQKELDLTGLAFASDKFKDHIPDRVFSMAALQGYLMMHKGRPYDAIRCAEEWVKEERAKKAVKDTMKFERFLRWLTTRT